MKTDGRQLNHKKIIYAGTIVLFSILCITSGSFWGDEICRVEAPIYGSFKDIWRTAKGFAQPGYLFWITLWTKLLGTSEYIIRCSNIPFVLIQIAFVFKIIEKKEWPMEYAFLFFLHPMFAYYMDEATPYMAVYAFALGFVYYVFFTEDQEFKNIQFARAFRINLVFTIGFFIHFIFGFIYILYVVHYLLVEINDKKKRKNHFIVVLSFVVVYIPLLLLYVDGLFSGTPTGTGFGIKNIAFIIYAFLGMSGIGLSRNDLRAGNFTNISWWNIIALGLVCAALLLIAILFHRKWKTIIKNNKVMIISCIVYFLVFLSISKLINFGVWERHCMSVFPVYVILICDIVSEIMKSDFKGIKIATMLYGVLLLISIGNIRFNYYYSCDDYKGVYQEISTMMEEKEDVHVLTDCSGEYYNFNKCVISDKQQIIDTLGYDENEILNMFNENSNDVLVLFEKSSTKEFYHSFDNKANVSVNNHYNSFKIVTHKE